MKKFFSKVFYLTAAIILPICLISSLTSAFKIDIIPWTLAFSAIPAITFAALEITDSDKKLLWFAASGYSVVFFAVALFKFDTLLSQITYAANCMLKYYAAAYPIITSIKLTDTVSNDAGFLMAMLCVFLAGIFSICLLRLKRYLPVLLLSLLVLVPCFIVVNSVPDTIPLIFAVVILISLYATSFLRKHSNLTSGYVLGAAAIIVLCASIIICSIFPQKNFERLAWQDSILYEFETMTGIRNTGGLGELAMLRDEIQNEVSLQNQGKLTQTHTKAMKVLADDGGLLYLRGISYANYEDNTWSVLTDDQEENFPKNADPFVFYGTQYAQQISVITEGKSAIAYYPYFFDAVPEKLSVLHDVLLNNKDKIMSYDYHAEGIPDSVEYDFISTNSYEDYISQNYTALPQETKRALLDIARSDETLSHCISEGSYDDIVRAVKSFVSSKGYYNLNCGRMPAGKDFPVWFLTEAESGYCVHYASAATAMLRALGIPARYVTGYFVNAEHGTWTTVTSDNAHAWTEIYDSNYGWRPVEVTPPDFRPAQYIPEQVTQNTEDYEVEPTSAPTETQPTFPQNTATKPIKLSVGLWTAICFFLAILLAVMTLFIRALLINKRNYNSMNSGDSKSRAIHTYRYILRLDKYKKSPIPEEIEDIALKAKFSDHEISVPEARAIKVYALRARRELFSNSGRLKRLYLRFIIGI